MVEKAKIERSWICPDLSIVSGRELWKIYQPLKMKYRYGDFVKLGGYVPTENHRAMMILLRNVLRSLKQARIENKIMERVIEKLVNDAKEPPL